MSKQMRAAPLSTTEQQLVEAAVQIAAGKRVEIPHTDRTDAAGGLARALRLVQEAAAARSALIEHAPVGICRTDRGGRLLSVNRAYMAMLGHRSVEEVVGRLSSELIHPDDRGKDVAQYLSMAEGREDHYEFEQRCLRADGGSFWTATTCAPVRGPDGRPESFVAIIEDISERRRQTERAAQVQRQLLPQSTPEIAGYQLAGSCVPAQDVAGDFYDWVLTGDGHLDLTLADVMGKGIGAAMVMATLHTALRTVPRELGPAARARLAAESTQLGLDEGEGLFVTLFQARLDLASGSLRYVDAGHGHWAIQRRGGEIVHPSGRPTLPLFVMPDREIYEEEVRLEPGDTLLLYSDGLVEWADRTVELSEYAHELAEATDVEDVIRRLTASAPVLLNDDITIVVLKRL
jgi:PAS domain S-box-containing protein